MARIKMFIYRFSNGHVDCMEPSKAVEYCKNNEGVRITSDGYLKNLSSPLIKRIKDGFEPGWSHALGMHVGGKREYQKILNRRGLVEYGKEQTSETNKARNLDSETIRELKELGADLSDQQFDALSRGERLHKEHDTGNASTEP